MAIDPNIILQAGRGVTPPMGPAEQEGNALTLQSLRQRNQVTAAALEDRQLEIAKRAREAAGNEALAASVKKHTKADPDTGDIGVDYQGVANDLNAAGFGTLASSWLKMQNDNAEALEKLATARRAHAKEQLGTIGDLAFRASSADDFTAGVALAAAHGLIPEDQARGIVTQVQQADPEAWRRVAEYYRKFSPAWQAEQSAAGRKSAADVAKAEAETAKLQAEVAGTLPPSPAQQLTAAGQAETARHNKEMERIQSLNVGREQAAQAETARHNRAMEESARMTKTARPVTAGDAEDLSNFDTSLDDLKVLRSAISTMGTTGTVAAIGAGAPNWVTNLTGWGTDAKKKQALIDRVKQVIGKTLEGGVLRKEDELKYEKILPTIGDPNAVVVEKLNGLESAIAKRKGRRLESLEDAGFNVERYRNRGAAGVSATSAPKPTHRFNPATGKLEPIGG